MCERHHTDDESRECNSEKPADIITLCRHHHNKATITNSFTFLGGFQATSHGVTPLGRLKESRNSEGFFMLVLFFFSAEAMTQPQTVTCMYNTYKYSLLLMLLQGQGCNVLFGTVFLFFFSLLENVAA